MNTAFFLKDMCPIKPKKLAITPETHEGTRKRSAISSPFRHADPFRQNKISPGGFLFAIPALLSLFASFPAFSANLPHVPACILALPAGQRAVVVDKAHQRLLLMTHGIHGLMIEKRMICTTGQNVGNKEKPGDRRTPEGIYFCRDLRCPPRLPALYGPCALPLNYPNPIDQRNHHGGKGIWIHGIHETRLTRSTRGCVVLQNRDLVYLAQCIHPLITPIIIEKKVRNIPKPRLDDQAEADKRFLTRWKTAYASGNLRAFLACYAPSFSPCGASLARWRRHKALLFERYHHRMRIQIGRPTILHTPAYDLLTFWETFDGGSFHDRGIKRLYLTEGKKGKTILAEEWLPLSLLEKAETAFRKTMTRVAIPNDPYRIIATAQNLAPSSKKPAGNLTLGSDKGKERPGSSACGERSIDFNP